MFSVLRKARQAALFATGAFVAYDTAFEDARVMRNARMIHAALLTLVDYKYYFSAENASEVHQRVADRLLHVFRKNGGLYVKFGQGIASMNHVLPPEFRKTLAVLQDQAPVVEMEAVSVS
jgi:aarF domain-containing kinase